MHLHLPNPLLNILPLDLLILGLVDSLRMRLFLDRGVGERDAGGAVEGGDLAVDGAGDAERATDDLRREAYEGEFLNDVGTRRKR